jgi:ParB family chromosome partitioning protein
VGVVTRHRQSVAHLAIEQLASHPGNLRDDLGDLTEMAASIREHGILQPLVVTEHTDGERFVLLAGHRRLGAARLAGLTKVPVVVRHGVEDSDHIVLMLVENMHRRELDPIERAEAYGALRNQGLSLADIARRAGTAVSSVSRYLALLDLDERSRQDVRDGALSTTTALSAVREVRQTTRTSNGAAAVGRPPGVSTGYFNQQHRLASAVRRACRHRNRLRVGGVGCGVCWEQAIRADQGEIPEPPPPPALVDEVVVQRRTISVFSARSTT